MFGSSIIYPSENTCDVHDLYDLHVIYVMGEHSTSLKKWSTAQIMTPISQLNRLLALHQTHSYKMEKLLAYMEPRRLPSHKWWNSHGRILLLVQTYSKIIWQTNEQTNTPKSTQNDSSQPQSTKKGPYQPTYEMYWNVILNRKVIWFNVIFNTIQLNLYMFFHLRQAAGTKRCCGISSSNSKANSQLLAESPCCNELRVELKLMTSGSLDKHFMSGFICSISCSHNHVEMNFGFAALHTKKKSNRFKVVTIKLQNGDGHGVLGTSVIVMDMWHMWLNIHHIWIYILQYIAYYCMHDKHVARTTTMNRNSLQMPYI